MNEKVVGLVGLAALAGALVIVACPEREPDRRAELITAVVEDQIIPDLEDARARAEALATRLDELCVELDAASLDAAQAAWSELRAPWRRLIAVPIGPIVDEGYDMEIDFWPARPSSIEGGLASGTASQAELDALGVASKGMPAIEYLLWDPDAGDDAILSALTDDPARCAYAALLADDVALRLSELDEAWRDVFATQLLDAGSSSMYPDLAVAIDALINAAITGLHDVDDLELAKPLGLKSGGDPDPELVRARFSDRSLAEARDALAGFERFYVGAGDDSPGLTILVEPRNPELDAEVRAAIAAAKDALAAVPEPLRTALFDDPEAVSAAADAVKQLRVLMTADVAALLGVTVSLSDNDGD